MAKPSKPKSPQAAPKAANESGNDLFSNEGPMADQVRGLITTLGEDPSREGLQRTPGRHLKAMRFLTQGYQTSIPTLLNGALFDVPFDEMVIVKDIEFYSLCEHHLLPFFGKCHVAYLPKGKVIGLSKIPRIVDTFARRLQVQEKLTGDIAQCLMKVLKPYGVGVVMEAQHLCMMMRGVEKQGSSTLTSKLLGDLRRPATRAEFFNLIK